MLIRDKTSSQMRPAIIWPLHVLIRRLTYIAGLRGFLLCRAYTCIRTTLQRWTSYLTLSHLTLYLTNAQRYVLGILYAIPRIPISRDSKRISQYQGSCVTWSSPMVSVHSRSCISAGKYLCTWCSEYTNLLPCTTCSSSSMAWFFFGYVAHWICLGLHQSAIYPYHSSTTEYAWVLVSIWNSIP